MIDFFDVSEKNTLQTLKYHKKNQLKQIF